MDFSAKSVDLLKLKTDCLVLPIFAKGKPSTAADSIDKLTSGALSRYLKTKDLPLKPGKAAWLPATTSNIQRILITCIGTSKEKTTLTDVQLTAKMVVNAIKAKTARNAHWHFESLGDLSDKAYSTAVAQAFETALYQYTETKKTKDSPKLAKLSFGNTSKPSTAIRTGLTQGKALAEGMNTARELGNLPANICTPTYLANLAKSMGKGIFDVKVLTEKQMEKLGMGSFLSVSAGSDEPGHLIAMEYFGADKKQAPVVLVGKGITFDTGGISLKPGGGMDEMKYDMCGAASVFGTMAVIKALKPKINVVGVVAAAENMPSGRATKPGDVVTSMSGQTIEILNTDAEGRLVLCDALTYVERYKPKAVIDIATLTGAIIVALGKVPSGLFANDQKLADALLKAGDQTKDRLWQLPIWDDYQKQLDSNFADMANIGGREGGSITAACFLARFAKKYKWAHLDIAGTAWHSGKAKGATGRPVPLLSQYLLGLFD